MSMSDNNNGPWGQRPSGSGRLPENDNIDDVIKKSKEKIHNLFNGNNGGDLDNKKLFLLIAVAFFILWLSSGFYIVQEGSRGVEMRFGAYHDTKTPGLNYHLPYPIDTVVNVTIDAIRSEEIGFRSAISSDRFFSGDKPAVQSVLNESLMLTGDENIVDAQLDVQWKISDAKDYLFNVRDLNGENTVKSAAESAIRDVIGETEYTKAIEGDGRAQIANDTRDLLQQTLDSYKMGVLITSIQIKAIDPPAQVIDVFRDVQTARADKEKAINQAQAYSNDILPRANGDAEKVIQDAEGYAKEVVARAEGESQRFIDVYNKYRDAKAVTRQRIYLETMEEALRNVDKFLIDNKGNGLVPFLPLNQLKAN